MLDILKNKILSWTPEDADAFFRGVPRYSQLGGRIWEIAPTGYYLWSAEYAGYFDNNGKTYELFIKDTTSAFTFKQTVSDYVNNSGSSKIEKPTLIQSGDIYGLGFTYVEQQRPYDTLGINLMNMISVPTTFEENYLQIVKQAILSYEQLVTTIDIMQGNQTSSMYPTAVWDSYCLDPITQNTFWAGPIEFVTPREDSIKIMQASTAYIDTFLQGVCGHTNARSVQADLNNFIKTQCTILQLP
jgi:hypothetical protein